jgi:hypothetical protein
LECLSQTPHRLNNVESKARAGWLRYGGNALIRHAFGQCKII